ncbi:MAG: hypothetical protein AB8G22_09285, partial [Saprospiraceae bacterium]
DLEANQGRGAAYVYEYNDQWVLVAILTASDASNGSFFGLSTAIHCNTIIVSGYRQSTYGEI